MKIYINDDSIENSISKGNFDISISNLKKFINNKKCNLYADIQKVAEWITFYDNISNDLFSQKTIIISHLVDKNESTQIQSQSNVLYIKSELQSIENKQHTIIAEATDDFSKGNDTFIFNFLDNEYSSRSFLPVVKIDDKYSPYSLEHIPCLPNSAQEIESFIYIHNAVDELIAVGLDKKFRKPIENLYIEKNQKEIWKTWRPSFSPSQKAETLFPLGDVSDFLIKALIINENSEQNYSPKQYKEYFANQVRKIEKIGNIIAEINGWEIAPKEILLNNNKQNSDSPRKIYQHANFYIAIDTKKSDFEVHDSTGKWLGAISFDRKKYEVPTKKREKTHKLIT